jgi:hypothetical protein
MYGFNQAVPTAARSVTCGGNQTWLSEALAQIACVKRETAARTCSSTSRKLWKAKASSLQSRTRRLRMMRVMRVWLWLARRIHLPFAVS